MSRCFSSCTLACGLLLCAFQASADDAPKAAPGTLPPAVVPMKDTKDAKAPGGKFLRVNRNDKGVVTGMDTSIARYVPAKAGEKAPVVDLISAVHVGEKAYYEALDKAFENYDVVLYELVAPEGTRVPKGGGERRGVVSGIQGGMKDLLDLEFQLEKVDYTKKNFVHADMSPEQMSAAMKKNNESMMSMMFKMMGASMAMQSDANAKGGGGSEMDMLFALFDTKNRAIKLKRAMAVQFENMEDLGKMFGGANGSTLIEGRNEAALEVLKKEIAAGKKTIAVFYGGGHMPDMEKRLVKDFGMKFEKEDWLEAWGMPEPVKKK